MNEFLDVEFLSKLVPIIIYAETVVVESQIHSHPKGELDKIRPDDSLPSRKIIGSFRDDDIDRTYATCLAGEFYLGLDDLRLLEQACLSVDIEEKINQIEELLYRDIFHRLVGRGITQLTTYMGLPPVLMCYHAAPIEAWLKSVYKSETNACIYQMAQALLNLSDPAYALFHLYWQAMLNKRKLAFCPHEVINKSAQDALTYIFSLDIKTSDPIMQANPVATLRALYSDFSSQRELLSRIGNGTLRLGQTIVSPTLPRLEAALAYNA